jgi:hypothetical protein
MFYQLSNRYYFRKVSGNKRFLKNTSNNIDLALITVFTFYFSKRVLLSIGNGYSDFRFESTLPWYQYTTDLVQPKGASCNTSYKFHLVSSKKISTDLFIDVVINLMITILSAAKVMIYIRSIETFSILSQLVLTCLYDVLPFSVFFILWIFYFSIIQRILGQ